MSDLQTNLNTVPYFDDYDRNKRFYRILFVPKRAVQVRELNQQQTIIQEQIRRFGDHVFKDGSVVDGCNITHVPSLEYVRLDNGYNAANANNAFDKTLNNYLVVSNTTGVRASIRLVSQGYQNLYPDTNTLYIDYVKSGRDAANNQVTRFQPGEELTIYNSSQPKTSNILDINKIFNKINVYIPTITQASTGKTYAVSVGEGIVYQKGFFVNVNSHTIVVAKYSTEVDAYFVGFQTNERIVTHFQDTSLLDPVNNQNNTAVGADRLKLEPVLVSKLKSSLTDDDDFFPIIEFNGGKPVEQKTEPEYAKLGEVMATRTWEAHGDFHIKPFICSSEPNANTSLFNYTISSGTAYVKGQRVELINTKRIAAPRATTLSQVNANIVTINYGYYVFVNELVGVFDYDNFTTVDIYNTPQSSITNTNGGGTPVTGVKIGTATIRNIIYDSGTKGTASARYRAYISNIVVNAAKTFSSDAKSLYVNSGAYGKAKADIVLESGKAVIKESGNDSLIFTSGLTGLRRLTDGSGVNDTQYYVRDTTSATIQSNGFATFTLNSPYAGGVERFFTSTGTLSSVNENRVDVVFGSAAFTSNNMGTVNSTTTGVQLIGSGSTFTTSYAVGDYIQVNANSSVNYIRKIVSIANNTSINLDASVNHANVVATHAKFFPQGHVLDLSGSASINVLSNTQFSLSTGLSFSGGTPQTIYASYPILRSSAVPAKKSVKKSIVVKINCSTGGITGPWNLGLTDIYAIESVFVGTSYLTSNPDRKDWFILDSGQRSTHYDHGKLVLKPQFRSQITSLTKIIVQLNYFQADIAAGVGFFTVESYPIRDPGVTANNTNISYSDIPKYNGYDLRDSIDFRPQKFATAAAAITIAAATTNPAPSNSSFMVSGSGAYLAEPDSNFQADAEFYLPRMDMIQVNKQGEFNVKSSTPNLNPRAPIVDADAMSLATAYVPPFPSLTSLERVFGIDKVSLTMNSNRNYTMRDINVLDRRISNAEYYNALSALETAAKDMSIKDANGLDRFKNGIFADPMNTHKLSNFNDLEYSVAIDAKQSIARPRVITNSIDLKVSTKTNTYSDGKLLSLPYTSVVYAQQDQASKYRNLTESVWGWEGDISLFPSYDSSRDDTLLPDINVTIDNASPWEQFENSPIGSVFGDWRTTSATTSTTSTTSRPTLITSTTTSTTTNTSTRTVTDLLVSSSLSTQDLGTHIVDITMSPFMRSREVAFICNSLKPNTNYWVYFDRVAVSAHCAQGTLTSRVNTTTGAVSVQEGRESDVVLRTAAWGTLLLSDSQGRLSGLFKIPAGTFRTGDRELLIANVDSLVSGEDAIISSARSIYTASAIQTTSQGTNLNVIQPSISSRTSNQVIVTTAVSARTTQTNIPVVRPTQPNQPRANDGTAAGNSKDPLGQSFLIDAPKDIPGLFLDKIGVFFKSKDTNLGVTCVLCEMTAGFPDTSKTLSKAYLKSSGVLLSNNGSVETIFDFIDIPYLTNGKSYAFFLQPDGNSPEYSTFLAEIGGTDIQTGKKIFTNPYIGVAFRSSNSETWNTLLTEDLKFKVYRCAFTGLTGSVTFEDQPDEYLTVNGFTSANTSTYIQVGDVVYSQNNSGGLLTSNTSPFATVQSIDYATDKLVLDGSTGGFIANTTIQVHRPPVAGDPVYINANTAIATTTIKTVDNFEYSLIVPRFGIVTPFGTTVGVNYKGRDLTGTQDITSNLVQNDVEFEMFDKTRTIKSFSNRGATNSLIYTMTLQTPTTWISPVIDLRRRSCLVIKNIINNLTVDEHTRYGDALAKYISPTITLREGQDAEDLKVFITAHRPVGTDVVCYVKYKNNEDIDTFDNKLWTKMVIDSPGGSTFCSSSDPQDMREYSFSNPSTEYIQGSGYANLSNNNILQYRDSAGSIYVTFKQFAIKLVLISDKQHIVPRISDVFATALQT